MKNSWYWITTKGINYIAYGITHSADSRELPDPIKYADIILKVERCTSIQMENILISLNGEKE